MRKTTLYTCLALASSVLVLGTTVNAAPLSTTPANATRPTLLDLLRHGADDNLANRHHGRDHSPNYASNDDRGSASSHGHGADDGAGHEHRGSGHGGGNDDGPGDDHGGRH